MNASINVSGLTKFFGNICAVDNISFSLTAGVLGFLGPNGAGKSTTMKIITGFLTPDKGGAYVCGYDIQEEPLLAKASFGYLPEGAPVYPEMSVINFLSFVASIRGFTGKQLKRKVGAALEQLSLNQVAYQRIETLSKGFRRRVGLAQALIHDPKVLILDEPTDGLDPNQKYEVRNLITQMANEKVIILSTHILEEVEALCDRAIVVANGRIVEDSTPEELVQRSPLHNTVIMTVRNASHEQLRNSLLKLDEIKALEAIGSKDKSTINVRIYPKPGFVPVIEDLTAVVMQEGWELRDISMRRGHLDEVFREITTNHKV